MKVILSCTADDLYLFNLPFAIYSWHKIGVECVVFFPDRPAAINKLKLINIAYLFERLKINVDWQLFTCPEDKEVTYAQCARLYAAALPAIDNAEVLITADADMCVFNNDYWEQLEYNGAINIVGADLVAEGQVPMCYIAMPTVGWRHVMDTRGKTYQECLDELLGAIECDNFRGNYWAKDQETAYNEIMQHPAFPVVRYNRASPGTQFATRRADRDSWPAQIPLDIIDAHLPRPGYTQENFEKISDLFKTMYPNDDHSWMFGYCSRYLKLMEND